MPPDSCSSETVLPRLLPLGKFARLRANSDAGAAGVVPFASHQRLLLRASGARLATRFAHRKFPPAKQPPRDDGRRPWIIPPTPQKMSESCVENKRFRDFVEGVGRDFGNLYIRVTFAAETLEFGRFDEPSHCGEATLQVAGVGVENRVHVTMCRPFHFAISRVVVVIIVYFLISSLSLIIVRRLDKRATDALAGFMEDYGVHVDTRHGLVGILEKIRGIRTQLDVAKAREPTLIDAKARAELAEQVAHDIRSPLEALSGVVDAGKALPDEDRSVMRDSVRRLRDIANGLLEKSRLLPRTGGDIGSEGKEGVFSAEPLSVQPLDTLIGPVVSEKRLGARERDGVFIEHALTSASCVLFGEVQATEFKRVISNLLSNGIEALDGDGSVTIGVLVRGERIEIKVQDTGRGIAPELLGRLGRRGETHGKTGGSGLGLHHAKSCVERWGGNLDISSVPGEGAAVTLDLPRAKSPPWAVSEVQVRPGAPVVVVDDDPGVHKVWQKRFDSLEVKAVELLHFSTPKELRGWVQANAALAEKAIFLVDYQFVGYPESGLDLIESLVLRERSILVTGRFDDKRILEECLRLEVRLLPKVLAAQIPIFDRPLSKPTAVA